MKKIKRVLIPILAVLIIGTIFAICDIYISQKETNEEEKPFTVVYEYSNFSVIYDNETKVMYVVSNDGDVTLLVNADGSPRIYKTEKKNNFTSKQYV